MNAIVIGCGRIGAGLTPARDSRNTHVGALAHCGAFNLNLFDGNREVAQNASREFGVPILEKVTRQSVAGLSLAVVCSPTETHFDYLQILISAKVPVIVCEKPICYGLNQLAAISSTFESGSSRVLVNYTRRFQPAYVDLQIRIHELMNQQELKGCAIRYQRGFLNNASHAIDLLQFLLGWDISDATVQVTSVVGDEFIEDPTISCAGGWNGATFSVVGLPYVRFSLFEIDLFFERDSLRIRDRGDTIEEAAAAPPGDYYSPLRTVRVQQNCMAEPFVNLYRYVETMMSSGLVGDNFKSSVAMTNWMINVLARGD